MILSCTGMVNGPSEKQIDHRKQTEARSLAVQRIQVQYGVAAQDSGHKFLERGVGRPET